MLRKKSRSFKDLIVWQKAHQFVLKVYKITGEFPRDERFGLISQLRRSAISVPSNIAEGFRKRGKRDKARFLNIAEGSLEEARYQLILAKDLGYADTSELLMDIEAIAKLLFSYAKAILASLPARRRGSERWGNRF